MADKGYLSSIINSFPANLKRSLQLAFEHIIDTIRFGAVVDQSKAQNFAAYFYTATTNSTALDEFVIAHQLGQKPKNLIQILPLDAANAQMVPLTVSRAADGAYIYLKSTSTSAQIFVMVEG
jgi:hypothetical protein